ncbi:MAG: hypothetical protein K6L74_07550 [Neptuniibacter sp.]
MVDPYDRNTATLPGIKEAKKLGRKPLFSKAMTAAQRKARQRREQDSRIMDSDFHMWTESDCMRILSTKKFEAFQKYAWMQLGKLKGYQ